MNVLKSIPLIIICLVMVGCAATKTKTDNDKYGPTCTHPTPSVFNITTKDTKQDTKEKREFYEIFENRAFSGIKSANLDDSILTISLVTKVFFAKYSAPLVDTIREEHREARPFLGLFGALGTLGLYPLLGFDLFSEVTFGCTNKNLLNTEPDLSRKVKTGKYEWRDVEKSKKILISGFDKDYEFIVDNKGLPITIDLSTAIFNTSLPKKSIIKVTCIDCDLLSTKERDLYKDVKASIELESDFRPIKSKLIDAQKLKLVEEEKKRIEQVESDKTNMEVERKKQGLPLDDFKIQCKELGFKVGTPDFGNCVLELNEAK